MISNIINHKGALMFKISLLSVCLCALLAGCESNNNSDQSSQFSQYLKLKNIPESDTKKIENERNNFLQREKLSQVALKQGLLDGGLLDVEINEYKKQLILSRYFEKFLKEKVNEQAVKNYYSTNASKYESKKVHVAHVLIRTNPKMSKEEREALLTKAHEVYSRANANEAFEGLAKAYSDDTLSVKKGGDLGWIKQGAIDTAFSNQVFAMKKGDISEPIKTSFGFHVVKVLDEPKVVKQAYEAVKGNIRYELRQMAKQAETQRLLQLAGIKKKAEK